MSQIALESPKGFPEVWLTRADEKYVIDRAHWNTEPAPPQQPPEKRFSYGVEIGAIIVRFYFGITGCIIPVACLPQFDELIFVFTTAGPCDADGRKHFYLLQHDPCLEATKLQHFARGFSSVADFHLNRKPGSQNVQPVAGGAEAVRLEYDKCGYDMPGEDTTVSVFDWSQVFKR
ncbi:hypothetical protein FB451DRAFT_1552927 [Mycena latifolia]|nr:hypothetical protein FB451DRAFT_1552927 [Mycena latifolia]